MAIAFRLRTSSICLRICALLAVLAPLSPGHGGNYVPGGGTNPGPGDTLPAPPPGAGGPTAFGPTTPTGPGPSSPGAGPSVPGAPSTPQGGPTSPGAPGATGPATPDLSEVDTSSWELWWHYEQHRWLDVRAAYARSRVLTGSDEFFLGRGGSDVSDRVEPSRQRLATELVPMLIETLRTTSSPDVASSALIALAKARAAASSAGVDVAPHIAAQLAHGNVEISETAAVALGMLGAQSDCELLASLVRGDVAALRERTGSKFDTRLAPRTRAFAAYGVAAAAAELDGYRQLVLANVLRDVARAEIDTRGPDEVIAACVFALAFTRLPDAPPTERFGSNDPGKLFHAGNQLEFLISLAETPRLDESIRATAVAGIARVGARLQRTGTARAWLTERWCEWLTSRTTERGVRRAAVAASPQLAGGVLEQDRKLFAALITVAESIADSATRTRAFVALGEASGAGRFDADADEALAFLIAAVGKGSSALRPWAALGLGLQQRLRRARELPTSNEAVTELSLALRETRSAYTAGAFALALGLCGDGAATEGVVAQLERMAEPGARGYFCLSLGLLGAGGERQRIAELARGASAQPALLSQAALALGLLGDRREVASLSEMFASSSNSTTHAGLATALGLLGDARAIEPLLKIAGDTQRSSLMRAFAVVALGGIAEDRALPWNAALTAGTDYLVRLPTLVSPLDGRGVLDVL
ncbi:MAG: hypothetical protein IT454_13360 [Planctomycetes bacterium]|nr:hypothetical protein [Planctomycetota bacterium]